jgi:cell division transport system ATP-binding protein
MKQPTILHREDHRDAFLIQCLQISKSYPPGQQVFRDANLEVRRGELVFLLGAGGSGKSALIRLLLGLEPLSQGHILFEGRDMQRLPRKEILFFRRCTGVVFQDFKLIKNRTVFENVALPLEIAHREHFFIRRKVHGILRLIGLDHKMDMPCIHLSGGEQQQVALARAIINDPLLLLVDEPTGCLDETALHSAMELIERVHAQGATVLVATRDRSLPEKIPEGRVVAIKQGGFVESNVLASSVSGMA